MKSNFNDCLNRLLKDEGGYTNDPADSGGATNFGITIADYRKYINAKGTPQDVKAMSVSQAKAIYKSKYWDALDCDNLPSGVDYTCFDYGVNSGLGRPRAALKQFKSLTGDKLIDAINDERMNFLRSISKGKNAKFLKGWTSRVNRVRAYSHVLSTQSPSPTAALVTGAAAGGGALYTMRDTLTQHPYLIAGICIVVAVAVGYLIHKWKHD